MKAIALAAAWMFSSALQAAPLGDPATLLGPDALRRQPRVDAAVVVRLPAGEPVGVLERQPGWVRVASPAGTGWVRMFNVAGAGAAAAGPGGPSPPAAEPTRGAGPLPAPARPSSHALLLGIGGFTAANITPLPGVAHDLQSARVLALAMGVPAAQITVARDAELSLEGMVRKVQQLVARVQAGDRVFLYYSGHGTRYRDSGRPGSPCVTSLLSHDGAPFTDSMMAEALNLLAQKTDKLFVFVDACFSGGAVAAARGSGLTAKFFARTGASAQCGAPSNVVARGLDAKAPQQWKARDNFIYLTAARDTEIAFEESASGGFATRAFRDCALREARDLDGSGSLSVDEIRQCAQQRIDSWLGGHRDYTPHHLTLVGNRDFVPTLGPAAPAAPAATAATAAQDAAAVPPAPTRPADVAIRPDRTLRDIFSQRDDRRQVSVKLSRKALKIGHDLLDLSVTSSHPGYLYLLYAGSDGKSFDMLFPNRLDRDNFIDEGRELPLPRAGWTLEARGPAGSNRLLAIVSDSPRDFSGLGMQASGVFSSLAATPQTARAVVVASTTARDAPGTACAPGTQTGKPCSNAYGAALVEITEVP